MMTCIANSSPEGFLQMLGLAWQGVVKVVTIALFTKERQITNSTEIKKHSCK